MQERNLSRGLALLPTTVRWRNALTARFAVVLTVILLAAGCADAQQAAGSEDVEARAVDTAAPSDGSSGRDVYDCRLSADAELRPC